MATGSSEVDIATAPTTPNAVATSRYQLRTLVTVGLVAVLAATVVGLFVGGGRYSPPAPDLVDAGPLASWSLALTRAIVLVSGMATFGWLLYAAFLGPQKRNGQLGSSGTADLRRARLAAGLWAISSGLAAALSLAVILGTPLWQAVSPTVVRLYAWDIPTVRAYALSAVAAAAIWAFARSLPTLSAAAGWSVVAGAALAFVPLAGHSASYGDHALALTAGVVHVWAAAAWFGGLLALAVHAWRGDRGVAEATVRYSRVATIAVVVLLGAGIANGYTRMDTLSDLWNSGYGRLLTLKALVFVLALVIAMRVRARLAPELGLGRSALAKLVSWELGLLALAGGFAVALALTPYPRVDNSAATVVEQLLGRSMPEAPTLAGVIFGWQFEPLFLVGSIVAAAYYIAGVARLRARGDAWPVGRTIAFLLGISMIIWTTNSGLATYSSVSFSLHMSQHMMLSMIAPILLVLGTPITLALRAIPPTTGGRRGPREWIIWAINSPVAKFVTNPLWVMFVFTIGLYGLYYTPLFSWLMGSHLGHVAMQLHFLAAGYLFAYVILGLDPTPRPLPPWVRLLMLLVAIALHSFFAVPMMMSDVAFANEWYSQVQPPWIESQLAETRLAGGIAWGIAEVPALILMVVLGVQWARSDERESRRRDRQADRDGGAELAAYNDRLRRLHEASQRRGE